MIKIEDFRKHAQECRQLAAGLADEEKRRMLLGMADAWDSLAKNRQKDLDRQVRSEPPPEQ